MSFLPFLDIGLKLIDKVIPDPIEKTKAKALLLEQQQAGNLQEMDASMKVILAEASGSYIQRNWRPITMLTFVFIIANNYILYPYLSLFWSAAPVLELPPEMWNLLNIGLGGYVVGRTVEKTMKNYKEK